MHMSLSLRLIRRFMRSRSLARSTLPVLVTIAVLVGVFVAVSAFTLSGAQVADRDLGRFSSQLELGAAVTVRPSDRDLVAPLAEAARAAGATDVTVSMSSFDVVPTVVDPPVVGYLETDWAVNPFPARYSLIDGRWPEAPGEVTITTGLRELVGSGTTLSVFSGNASMTVVGVARDVFGTSARFLAAPGTWSTFSGPAQDRFAPVAAPALSWNGGEQTRVAASIGAALARTTRGVSVADADALIAVTLRAIDGELSSGRRSWLSRLPIVYQLPSLGLPFLAVLTVFGLNARRFRRTVHLLKSVGVGSGVAVVSVAGATAGWIVGCVIAGALLGMALGVAVRPLCDAVVAGPISPYPAMAAPLSRLAVITALACLLGAVLLRQATLRPVPPSAGRTATVGPERSRRSLTVRHLRRAAASVVATVAFVQVIRLDSVAGAMILAGMLGAVGLLLSPEVTARAVRLLLRGDEPRVRLSREQLRRDESRAGGSVAVLAAALGAPLVMLTLLATLIQAATDDTRPNVAPGQLVLASPAGFAHPPPADVVETVARDVDLDQRPVRIGYLRNDTARISLAGGDRRTLLVVATVEDVSRLANRALDEIEARTVTTGGILIWDGQQGPGRELIETAVETDQVRVAGSVPAYSTDFEAAWTGSAAGLILLSTAEKLRLPHAQGALVFTGVSPDQAAAAEAAVVRAGLDPANVDVYEAPEPIEVPPVYWGAVAALGVVVLTTGLTLARTQVATLRTYLGRLIAVGVPPRWTRHVLILQNSVVVAVATMLAVGFAIPSIAIAVLRLDDMTLVIPWAWLGITLGAVYCAVALATMLSSRRLAAADRLTT